MKAKLVYHLDLGNQNASSPTLLARAAAIDVDQGSFDWLGVDLVGDVTATESANVIVRTITLETNAQGDTTWKTAADFASATRNLMNQIFSLRMPAGVTADEPVVTT